MADAEIPVDLFNPGQVFACLGFLEAADTLLGDAEGGFDWSSEADAKFCLRAGGTVNPFAAVLEFLRAADVKWLSPKEEIKERDGGETLVRDNISASGDPRPPDLPAVLIGEYLGNVHKVHFGYWADGSSRFSTTFKKSTNGASSHIRFMNALKGLCTLEFCNSVSKPFEQNARTESLFRLDPRASVDPIQAGTSPDKLRKGGIEMRVVTYPICEALAVLGMEHARPERSGATLFRYHVWSGLKSDPSQNPVFLSPILARAAINGTFAFLEARKFVVHHDETKKGGDRKMNSISEECRL